MKVKCEYCDNLVDDGEEKCPNCGAINPNYKRSGNGVPTTIEELETWYKEHNLPPYETTRFFIGIDYKEPKAFGIYKDESTGKFVVYKNKDTGERAIRYEGKDEKYAVNELYLKLKEEILNQKSNNRSNGSGKSSSRITSSENTIIVIAMLVIALPFFYAMIMDFITPHRGYYNIDDKEYYYVAGGWYKYSPRNEDWISTSKPNTKMPIGYYFDGLYYNNFAEYTSIDSSSVYDSDWDSHYYYDDDDDDYYSSSYDHDDWDSGSSWDSSDSWDSGSTDWGSDW